MFRDIIRDYSEYRPGYPNELFESIINYGNITKESKILEVGTGTGQATDYWISEGFKLDTIDISDEHVLYLREKYKQANNVTIKKCYFEEYEEYRKYDLIYGASSFHWINSNIRYKKAFDLLVQNGVLAQFWHMSPVLEITSEECTGLQKIIEMYVAYSQFHRYENVDLLIHKRVNQLTTNGFTDIRFLKFSSHRRYSASQFSKLLSTYSYIKCLPQKEILLDEVEKCINIQNDGYIDKAIIIHLYLARKEKHKYD